MDKKPLISVVVASYNAEHTIEACLDSLMHQSDHLPMEVIVVDSSTDATPGIVRRKFPSVALIHSNERKFCGDARNLGISRARADIVAFLDADCRARGDWAEEILKAHAGPYAAVGGSIANANQDSYIGWAAYFTEFSQWMPASHPEWSNDIAGANMSYKKQLFEKYGPFIEQTYCSDTEFHWRLQKRGIRLRFIPGICVYHRNIAGLVDFLRHEFRHGRSFARVLLRYGGLLKVDRRVYGVFSFLIPFWLLAKILARQIRNPIYLFPFIFSLPLLFLGLLSWSMGEASAYFDRRFS